jgi:FdhE protein
MTQTDWLSRHPYLKPIADLQSLVRLRVEAVCRSRATIPNWGDYASDYEAGVPLLSSGCIQIDLSTIGQDLASLVEQLVSEPLPGNTAEEMRRLHEQLRRDPSAPSAAAAWLLSEAAWQPAHPGLLNYLGWTLLARHLRPIVTAFGEWRNEERWLRGYCPLCGERPAMGQLTGTDPGRLRLLSCGRCGTRWRYRRTGCPFCEKDDDHRLASLAIEGECGLRIDYCDACGGYLKTYDGEGNEGVLLADWTSLHLDVIAGDRALKRYAASLYEL